MDHMPTFRHAATNTDQADADRFLLAADGYWNASMGEWLAAHTIDISDRPADWPPEFRELWAALLRARIRE